MLLLGVRTAPTIARGTDVEAMVPRREQRVKIHAMPDATNLGVKIHYEVEGSGPPLVLAHGLGYSGEDWRDFRYVDLMRQDFQLILVDHRGHGKSDKPHGPAAYSPEMRVNDHVAVLDAGSGQRWFDPEAERGQEVVAATVLVGRVLDGLSRQGATPVEGSA